MSVENKLTDDILLSNLDLVGQCLVKLSEGIKELMDLVSRRKSYNFPSYLSEDWMKGHDHTIDQICKLINGILSGVDGGNGLCTEPWNTVRKRLIQHKFLLDRHISNREISRGVFFRESQMIKCLFRESKCSLEADHMILYKNVMSCLDNINRTLNYPISSRNPQGYPDPIPPFDEEKAPDV
jgi:hypothetical protein